MITTLTQHEMFLRIIIALFLGVALGTERFVAHKTAGVRTYALISMGSALFIIISLMTTTSQSFLDFHMAAQIISAAGFLGAGVILHRDDRTIGMTTASGLWVSAGIGIACGFGLFYVAILATISTLFVFVVLWFIEEWVEKIGSKNNKALPEEK
ncbi:MAG: MgtC/SapB family protein [bacterium]